MELGTLFTKAIALSTLFGNAFILALLLAFVIARPIQVIIMRFASRYALCLGLLVSAASTIGSLLYSEVVGFPACVLCWTQRIFMYPLMFLFALALLRKERHIMPYAFMLSVIGALVAGYQWVKDMLLVYSDVTIPCPAVTSLPSCDKIYVLEYGYITIPMFALNAFVLIAILTYAAMRAQKEVIET